MLGVTFPLPTPGATAWRRVLASATLLALGAFVPLGDGIAFAQTNTPPPTPPPAPTPIPVPPTPNAQPTSVSLGSVGGTAGLTLPNGQLVTVSLPASVAAFLAPDQQMTVVYNPRPATTNDAQRCS